MTNIQKTAIYSRTFQQPRTFNMQTASPSSTTNKSTALDNLLTRSEFCQQYGISYRTAEMMAHKGQGPRVTRLGARAFYHVDDIAAWVDAQRKKADARFKKAGAK